MNEMEYFKTGKKKAEGNVLSVMDCTSRGSGESIVIDDHPSCVECVAAATSRRIGP